MFLPVILITFPFIPLSEGTARKNPKGKKEEQKEESLNNQIVLFKFILIFSLEIYTDSPCLDAAIFHTITLNGKALKNLFVRRTC